jgi:DNA-binding transcriptional ArsR family regulator
MDIKLTIFLKAGKFFVRYVSNNMDTNTIAHPKMKDVSLEQVLKALGDPVRISIVRQLLKSPDQERACGTFEYDVTKATFSHHLQILREAGVVQTRQEGTRRLTSLRSADMQKRFPGLLEMVSSSK